MARYVRPAQAASSGPDSPAGVGYALQMSNQTVVLIFATVILLLIYHYMPRSALPRLLRGLAHFFDTLADVVDGSCGSGRSAGNTGAMSSGDTVADDKAINVGIIQPPPNAPNVENFDMAPVLGQPPLLPPYIPGLAPAADPAQALGFREGQRPYGAQAPCTYRGGRSLRPTRAMPAEVSPIQLERRPGRRGPTPGTSEPDRSSAERWTLSRRSTSSPQSSWFSLGPLSREKELSAAADNVVPSFVVFTGRRRW